jgi:hypothetical protein
MTNTDAYSTGYAIGTMAFYSPWGSSSGGSRHAARSQPHHPRPGQACAEISAPPRPA